MIAQVHQQHAELPIERLCELFSVSRSWYYERSRKRESDAEEIALRDQIERIILEFSGYGYRRVTHAEA
jgi:putative transposase